MRWDFVRSHNTCTCVACLLEGKDDSSRECGCLWGCGMNFPPQQPPLTPGTRIHGAPLQVAANARSDSSIDTPIQNDTHRRIFTAALFRPYVH